MRPKYTKVRARSAKEGSATVGWSLAAPGPACFPVDKEDIAALPQEFEQLSGISLVPRVLEQANTSRLELPVEKERIKYAISRKARFAGSGTPGPLVS